MRYAVLYNEVFIYVYSENMILTGLRVLGVLAVWGWDDSGFQTALLSSIRKTIGGAGRFTHKYDKVPKNFSRQCII